MRITLIRHGEAGDDAPRDEERSLTKNGRSEVRRVGAALERGGVHFGAVVTSPLVRAVQTAEITAAAVGYRGRVIVSEQLIPDALPGRRDVAAGHAGDAGQEVGGAGRARAGAVARRGDAAADRALSRRCARRRRSGSACPAAPSTPGAFRWRIDPKTGTPPPSMTNRFGVAVVCRWARWLRVALSALGACAPPPPPVEAAAADRPLDLQLPLEAPDETTMARLPAAVGRRSAARSTTALETGPLQGPGNFNELDGAADVAYARSPYLVAEETTTSASSSPGCRRRSARPSWRRPTRRSATGSSTRRWLNYRKVIERDPLYAKAYFYVAEIESQRRDLEAATAWNDRGLRLSPRDAYGYALRAEILASHGARRGRARRRWRTRWRWIRSRRARLKLLQRLGGRAPGHRAADLRAAASRLARRRRPVLVARGGGQPGLAALRRLPRAAGARRAHPQRVHPVAGAGALAGRAVAGGRDHMWVHGHGGVSAAPATRGRGNGRADADLERWSRAYDANLLREAVIYETIGCRRPEVLAAAHRRGAGSDDPSTCGCSCCPRPAGSPPRLGAGVTTLNRTDGGAIWNRSAGFGLG